PTYHSRFFPPFFYRSVTHRHLHSFPTRRSSDLLLFHQRFAEPHVDAAFHLPAHQRRVEGPPDVMGHPDFPHMHPARQRVHFHFDDRGGIGIGWRRPDAPAFVKGRRFWRSVRAHRANRSEARLRETNRFCETDAFVGRGGIKDALARETQALFRHFEFQRDRFGEERLPALG